MIDDSKGFFRLVSSDVWRCTGATGLKAFLKAWFSDPAFRPVFTMRLCTSMKRSQFWSIFLIWGRYWHLRTRLRAGVDIPWNLKVGPGFKVLHGIGLVVNSDAVLGSNVTLMQGVTIGGSQRGIPNIGDDVIVCANATVIGGVTLHNACVVGAGAVVVSDVPAGAVVAGNPARLIKESYVAKGYFPLPKELR